MWSSPFYGYIQVLSVSRPTYAYLAELKSWTTFHQAFVFWCVNWQITTTKWRVRTIWILKVAGIFSNWFKSNVLDNFSIVRKTAFGLSRLPLNTASSQVWNWCMYGHSATASSKWYRRLTLLVYHSIPAPLHRLTISAECHAAPKMISRLFQTIDWFWIKIHFPSQQWWRVSWKHRIHSNHDVRLHTELMLDQHWLLIYQKGTPCCFRSLRHLRLLTLSNDVPAQGVPGCPLELQGRKRWRGPLKERQWSHPHRWNLDQVQNQHQVVWWRCHGDTRNFIDYGF